MKVRVTEQDVEKLRQELERVRKASLTATQRGDFRLVGKLTCQAAQLNRSIAEFEGLLLDAA